MRLLVINVGTRWRLELALSDTKRKSILTNVVPEHASHTFCLIFRTSFDGFICLTSLPGTESL